MRRLPSRNKAESEVSNIKDLEVLLTPDDHHSAPLVPGLPPTTVGLLTSKIRTVPAASVAERRL